MRTLSLLRLSAKATSILAEVATLTTEVATITTEVAALIITIMVETRALGKNRIHSLVSIWDNVVGEVQVLSKVLEARVRQGVVEMAPKNSLKHLAPTSCRSS